MQRSSSFARAAASCAAAGLLAACSASKGTASDPTPRADATVSTTTTAPTTTAPTPTQSPVFSGRTEPIDDATAARLTHSWRPGCPVELEDLSLLSVDYWGFDDVEHSGELIVDAVDAEALIGVFAKLYEARFQIERIELVEVYDGDDDRLGEANVTSAANCRPVTGKAGVWSQHAYGRAIDINPRRNPYASGDLVLPSNGTEYLDRRIAAPGMIQADDVVVSAFAEIGWEWGGYWSSLKDYQHFSATGR